MAKLNPFQPENSGRFKLFLWIVGIAVSAFVIAVFIFREPKLPPSTVQVAKSRPDAISGQAGGQGSEEYNKKLQQHDDKNANEALKSGQSFIATPTGNKKPVVGKKENTPPVPPAVVKVKTAPVQPPRQDNTLLKRMLEDLAALEARLTSVSAGTGKIEYQMDFSRDTAAQSPETVQNSAGKTVTSVKMDEPPSGLKPGDLLYAIIDTGVNSDVPSAVMATVAQGAYRNARMLGSFQRHDERMVLAFSRAILPSGKSVQLEAYAVDPDTSEASVASSVDTHFFSRWGGLVASAFLEGLGSAKKFSGATSTMYGYGNNASDQMVLDKYSPEDQAWIAAGKVGEKASKIFEKNFDRPPTVYLESGSPIGILILNVKEK